MDGDPAGTRGSQGQHERISWMRLNPETLSWSHDGKNVDGSPFDESLFDGFELFVDGTPFAAVPIGWNVAGNYSVPIPPFQLANGVRKIQLRLLSKSGVHSALSDEIQIQIETRAPSVPFGLAVAGGSEG